MTFYLNRMPDGRWVAANVANVFDLRDRPYPLNLGPPFVAIVYLNDNDDPEAAFREHISATLTRCFDVENVEMAQDHVGIMHGFAPMHGTVRCTDTLIRPVGDIYVDTRCERRDVHWGIKCSVSGVKPIVGAAYRHKVEKDLNLCEAAYSDLADREKAAFEEMAPPPPPAPSHVISLCAAAFHSRPAEEQQWFRCVPGRLDIVPPDVLEMWLKVSRARKEELRRLDSALERATTAAAAKRAAAQGALDEATARTDAAMGTLAHLETMRVADADVMHEGAWREAWLELRTTAAALAIALRAVRAGVDAVVGTAAKARRAAPSAPSSPSTIMAVSVGAEATEAAPAGNATPAAALEAAVAKEATMRAWLVARATATLRDAADAAHAAGPDAAGPDGAGPDAAGPDAAGPDGGAGSVPRRAESASTASAATASLKAVKAAIADGAFLRDRLDDTPFAAALQPLGFEMATPVPPMPVADVVTATVCDVASSAVPPRSALLAALKCAREARDALAEAMRKERQREKQRAARLGKAAEAEATKAADADAELEEEALMKARVAGRAHALFAKNAKGAKLVHNFVSRMVRGPKHARPTSLPALSETMRLARIQRELLELLHACGAPSPSDAWDAAAEREAAIPLSAAALGVLWAALGVARAQAGQ